jgi:FMN phosphatase YigB (HAD superfamily)
MRETKLSRPRVRLLVTDLDNTLWDWFQAWHVSFSAMLNKLSIISGVPTEKLEQEIRKIHQLRGTTEYTYLINEIPSIQPGSPEIDVRRIYKSALVELSSKRGNATKLYPGVRETLMKVRAANVPIVAYTESVAYWTEWRIKRTRLDGVINVLYSSPDHDFPAGTDIEDLRTHPKEHYGLKDTSHAHVPIGVTKPNALILNQVLSDYRVSRTETAYVGDSLMKDVAMANSVGVWAVHAKYSQAHRREEYDLLRRVSHWTDEDIEREAASDRELSPRAYRVLDRGYYELLDHFNFGD